MPKDISLADFQAILLAQNGASDFHRVHVEIDTRPGQPCKFRIQGFGFSGGGDSLAEALLSMLRNHALDRQQKAREPEGKAAELNAGLDAIRAKIDSLVE